MSNDQPPVDFVKLRDAAQAAMRQAYAPYSGFPVGAAAFVDDGRIVAGCNVEIYLGGVTMCAENILVGELTLTGGGKLIAFSCTDPAGNVLLPCGRCRQVLHEFGGDDMLVDTRAGAQPMSYLFPEAFQPSSSPLLRSRPAGATFADDAAAPRS